MNRLNRFLSVFSLPGIYCSMQRASVAIFAAVITLVSLMGATDASARARRSKIEKAIAQEAQQVSRDTASAPVDGEVCFAPVDPCDVKLVKFVEGAKKSVYVAIFDLNLDQLVHVIALASRKIDVRVLVDARQSKGDHSLVDTLIKLGVSVRYGRQKGIMHNKFIIRDGEMVETGSFNFTNHAAFANNENSIYLATPAIVERYRARFETIWAEGKPAN